MEKVRGFILLKLDDMKKEVEKYNPQKLCMTKADVLMELVLKNWLKNDEVYYKIYETEIDGFRVSVKFSVNISCLGSGTFDLSYEMRVEKDGKNESFKSDLCTDRGGRYLTDIATYWRFIYSYVMVIDKYFKEIVNIIIDENFYYLKERVVYQIEAEKKRRKLLEDLGLEPDWNITYNIYSKYGENAISIHLRAFKKEKEIDIEFSYPFNCDNIDVESVGKEIKQKIIPNLRKIISEYSQIGESVNEVKLLHTL